MPQHTITVEHWSAMTRAKQILNIASEFSRAYHWNKKKHFRFMSSSIIRVLELIDLTIEARTFSKNGLREFLRLREKTSEFLTPAGYVARSSEKEMKALLKALLLFDKETSGVAVV